MLQKEFEAMYMPLQKYQDHLDVRATPGVRSVHQPHPRGRLSGEHCQHATEGIQ